MVKVTRSLSFDDWVLDLSRNLGINRSRVAQDAILVEIGVKLATSDLNMENLKQLAEAKIGARKRATDDLESIAREKMQTEIEIIESRDQLHERIEEAFLQFCEQNQIKMVEFKESLLGEGQYTEREKVLEQILIGNLKNAGLLPDLNIVRETIAQENKVVEVR